MRSYYLILMSLALLVGTITWSEVAFAQDDDSATTDVSAAGDDDSAVGLDDVVADVTGIIDAAGAIKEAKGDRTAMFIAISALLAAVFKVLLDLLKLTGAAIFKNKTFLKVAPLVLGFIVFLCTAFAAGQEWYNALIMAFAGPGAIMITEISKLIPGIGKKD
jgi:hypothetical protein